MAGPWSKKYPYGKDNERLPKPSWRRSDQIQHRPKFYPLTPKEIYDMGMGIQEDPLARALFFFCYVTGARIGEAVQFRPMNLDIANPDFYKIKLPVLKKRKERGAVTRNVPVPKGERAKCFENEMMAIIIEFIKDLPIDSQPFFKWGAKSDPKRYDYMDIYLARRVEMSGAAQVHIDNEWMDLVRTKKLNPHWLRHCRASHLVQYYNFSDAYLRLYFNWEDSRLAATYTNFKDISIAFG